MKKSIISRFVYMLLVLIMLTSLMTGCKNDYVVTDSDLLGNWAYIHDTENTAVKFSDNGTAKVDGINYTYTTKDGYIVLTSSNGTETKMRYKIDNDSMYLYKPTPYTLSENSKADGIIGLWENKENKWSFEFTNGGTFIEDGYFPGYFTEDAANSTIKLIYNDHFEDTVLYYSIDGNVLNIEYPWTMVRMR